MRFRYSLAAMFVATAFAALIVVAGKACGVRGIVGLWVGVYGVAVIWRSGLNEKFSTFLLGVLILLIALAIAGSGADGSM